MLRSAHTGLQRRVEGAAAIAKGGAPAFLNLTFISKISTSSKAFSRLIVFLDEEDSLAVRCGCSRGTSR